MNEREETQGRVEHGGSCMWSSRAKAGAEDGPASFFHPSGHPGSWPLALQPSGGWSRIEVEKLTAKTPPKIRLPAKTSQDECIGPVSPILSPRAPSTLHATQLWPRTRGPPH
ncbi:hypothetical protein NDU88_002148 [Pleurodeles waltl]|uniref:Uncharacterized protein n=1 Tax=Pleurodeles waltl TaxID=8319 RepID=A0AAV7M1J4_PLEWA|nr:hypothetical protein NDU88_002148 [Pleurodeles waltl]